MPSNIEGRIALALHSYRTGFCKSLRAAASLYDVPHVTLSRRDHSVLLQRGTRLPACKLTLNEEEVLLQRILDLDA
jgi:hypothetical protein